MPTLEERVAALEAALINSGNGDTIQPNVLTVNANGEIGADFTGTISAQGITLPVVTQFGPGGNVQENEIRWYDPNDPTGNNTFANIEGNMGGLSLTSYINQDTPSAGVSIGADDANGNFTGIRAQSDGTDSSNTYVQAHTTTKGVTLIDDTGASDFARSGIGAGAVSVAGPATPQQFPGINGVSGANFNITIKNPNGARLFCVGGMSAYAAASAGAQLSQYLYIDGNQVARVATFYFNQVSVHQNCGAWAWVAGPYPAGQHTVQLAAYDANSLCDFDAGDSAFIGAIELP